jgi:hypothetical protein
MMDGAQKNVTFAHDYYAGLLTDRAADVKIVQSFITADNVNDVFRQHGSTGEIDLLSIDIDGNDYWVWKAINSVNPRVVVIEYNAVFGWERAVTIPYDPNYMWSRAGFDLHRTGASLAALTSLGRMKGYSLVGCGAHGVNAFFVRDDLAVRCFERLAPEQAYYPLRDRVHGLVCPISESEINDEYIVRVE